MSEISEKKMKIKSRKRYSINQAHYFENILTNSISLIMRRIFLSVLKQSNNLDPSYKTDLVDYGIFLKGE